MFQRDFILRQVQQLAQVLAQVLVHKRMARPEQAQEALAEGVEAALGLPLEALCRLPRRQFLQRMAAEKVSEDALLNLAALLYEGSDPRQRERALWLYEAALASGRTVPIDVYERIELLRVSVK
jgi:hypothetical protein